MSAGRIQIGELRIRVPGLSASDAHSLGQRVAADLAAAVAAGAEPRRSLSSVSMKVQAAHNATPANISTAIARAILGSVA